MPEPVARLRFQYVDDVWTDLSSRLRAYTFSHSRDEQGHYSPAVMTFTLDNTDRALDPDNTAGIYYPDVDTDRLLDFRETYTKTTGTTTDHDQFTGYTQGWELLIEYPEESAVLLTAVDASTVLALVKFAGTAHEQQTRYQRPTHWWRLGEPGGAVAPTTAADSVGTQHGTYHGTPTTGAQSLVPKDSDTAVTFDGVDDWVHCATAGPSEAAAISIAFWVKFDASLALTTVSVPVTASIGSPNATTVEIEWTTASPTGKVRFTVFEAQQGGFGTPEVKLVQSSIGIADGQGHHVVCTYSEALGAAVHIDGILRNTPSAGGPETVTIGGEWTIGHALYQPEGRYFKGTLDEVAVFSVVLTADEVAALHDAGRTAFAGESTRDRVNRYLDWADWPSADRVDPAVGRSTMQGITSLSNAWDEVQKAMVTEFSRAWITAQGKVAWLARDHTFEPPYNTSQATFSDAPTGTELGYEELSNPKKDGDRRRNEWSVSSQGQATQVSRDQADIDSRKAVRSGSRSIQTESVTDMKSMADLLLATYLNPPTRVESMELAPYGDEDRMYPEILTRRVSDRVTVKWTPPGGGAQVAKEAIVVGIQKRWDGRTREYRASYALSTAEA